MRNGNSSFGNRNTRRFKSIRQAIALLSGFLLLVSTNPALADGVSGTAPSFNAPQLLQTVSPSGAAQHVAPPVPAEVQQAAAQAAAAVKGAQLDLSSTAASVLVDPSILTGGQSVAVRHGNQVQVIDAGSYVTPAQFLAMQQVIAGGRQALQLGVNGAAAGGTFILNEATLGGMSGVVIPQGITALGLNHSNPLNGALVNFGNVYGISTNAANPTSFIYADSIVNAGLISTVVPGSVRSQFAGALSSANLVLGAREDITNVGTISSSGNLSLTSLTGAVSNLQKVNSAAPVVQAAGNVDIFAGNGIVNNAGLIAAGANINISGVNPNTNITVNAAGGTFQSGNNINVSTVNSNIALNGGNYLSQNLNLNAGTGTIQGIVGLVPGKVNASAAVMHFWADTPTLTLGDNCITGDPTFASTGNIVIDGTNTFSDAVTIIAQGDITSANSARIVAFGQDVTLIAGAQVTIGGSGQTTTVVQNGNALSIDITGGNGTGTYNAGPDLLGTATVDFSTPTGGNIDLSNGSVAPGLALIDTSNGAGNGGNVTLAAMANGGVGGTITLPSASLINTSSTSGNGGDVSVIAGGSTLGQAITMGSILTAGALNSGDVLIQTSQPTGNAGAQIEYGINGLPTGFFPSTFVVAQPGVTNASVTVADINTSGFGGGSGDALLALSGVAGGNAGTIAINAGSIATGNLLAFGGGGGGGGSAPNLSGTAGGAGGNGASIILNAIDSAGTGLVIGGNINTSGGGGGGGGAGSGFPPPPGGLGGAGGAGGASAVVSLTSNTGVSITGNIYAANGGSGGAGSDGDAVNGYDPGGGGGGGSFGGGGGGGAGSVGGGAGGGGAGAFGGGAGSGGNNTPPTMAAHDGGVGGGALAGGSGGVVPNPGAPGVAGAGGDSAPGGNPSAVASGGASPGLGGEGGAPWLFVPPGDPGADVSTFAPVQVTAGGSINLSGVDVYGSSVSLQTTNNGDIQYGANLRGSTNVTVSANGSGNVIRAGGAEILTPNVTISSGTGDIGAANNPISTNALQMTVSTGNGGSAYIENTNAVGSTFVANSGAGSNAGDTFAVRMTQPSATLAVDPLVTVSANTVGIQAGNFVNNGAVQAARLAIDDTAGDMDLNYSGTYQATDSVSLTADGNIDLASNGIDLWGGNWSIGGANLLVAAGGNVTATGDGVPRTLSTYAAGKAGDVSLVAGVDANYDIMTPSTVTTSGASATGGSVDFTGDTLVDLNTSDLDGGDGGDVNVIAHRGANAGSGRVLMPNSTITTTGFPTYNAPGRTNGDVTIIGGTTSFTGIQVGDIYTQVDTGAPEQSTGNTGDVSIKAAQPNTAMTYNSAVPTTAYGTSAVTPNGGIYFSDIFAPGGDVSIAAGGGISGYDINTSGSGGFGGAGFGLNNGGSAGDITLDATAGVNSIDVGYLRAFGGGGTGGGNTSNGGTGGNGGDITLLASGDISVYGDINSSGGGGGGGGIGFAPGGNGGSAGDIVVDANGNFLVIGPILASGGAGGNGGVALAGGAGGGSFGGGGGGAEGAAGGGGFVGGGGSDLGFYGSGGGVFGAGLGFGPDSTDGQSGAGGNGAGGLAGGLYGQSGQDFLGGTQPLVGEDGAGLVGGLAGNAGGITIDVADFDLFGTVGTVGGIVPGYNAAAISNSQFKNIGIGAYGTQAGGDAINITTTGSFTLGYDIGANNLGINFNVGELTINSGVMLRLGSVDIVTQSLINNGAIIALLGDVNISGLTNQGPIVAPAVPNLTNTGLITALDLLGIGGDINISSAPGQNLVVSGGGRIGGNLLGTANSTGTATLTATDLGGIANNYLIFSGNQEFMTDSTVLNAGGQNQTFWLQSGANVEGTGSVTVLTNNMVIDGTIVGSPLVISSPLGGMNISNTTGDLLLPNDFIFNGNNLAIFSVGSIIGTGINLIDLSNGAGNGGSLTLVAGFNLSIVNGDVVVGTPNAGGSIVLPDVQIDTSSVGGIGGSVLAVARNGSVTLGPIDSSATGAGSAGGSVNVIGNGITLASIDTSGIAASGNVFATSGIAAVVAGPVVAEHGDVITGAFGTLLGQNNGNIFLQDNLNAPGAIVALTTGGTGYVQAASGVQLTGEVFDVTAGTGGVGTFDNPLSLNGVTALVDPQLILANSTGNVYLTSSAAHIDLFNSSGVQFQLTGSAVGSNIQVVGTINSDNLLLTQPSGGTIEIFNDISGVDGINGANATMLNFVTDALFVTAGSEVSGRNINVDSATSTNLLISNAGSLLATTGDITINSANNFDIVIGGGGNMTATVGQVALNANGAGNEVRFTGDQYFGGTTNINATGAGSQISFDNGVTVQGTGALNLNTTTLLIGTYTSLSTLAGQPLRFNSPNNLGTIANSNGDVNLPTGLIFAGKSLTILASGNVNSAPGVSIDLSNSVGGINGGTGGTLSIFAGYDFTLATGGQVGPDGTVYYLGGASVSGGSVNMSGADITTKSSGGNGGNVLVLAQHGIVNSGSISLGNIETSTTFAGANAGTVTLFGRGGVTTGNITTTATTGNAGEVRVVAGTPSISTPVEIWNGQVNPSFVPGLLTPVYTATTSQQSGNILVGSINATSAGTSAAVSLITSGSASVNGKEGAVVTAASLVAAAGTGGVGSLANPLATNVNTATFSSTNGLGQFGNVYATGTAIATELVATTPSFITPATTYQNVADHYRFVMTGVNGAIVIDNGTAITAESVVLRATGAGGITQQDNAGLIDATTVELSTEGGNIGSGVQAIRTTASFLTANATALGNVDINNINGGGTMLLGNNVGNTFNYVGAGGLVFHEDADLFALTAANLTTVGAIVQNGTDLTIVTPTLSMITNGGDIGTGLQSLVIDADNLFTNTVLLATRGDVYIEDLAPVINLIGLNTTGDYVLKATGNEVNLQTALSADKVIIDTGSTGEFENLGVLTASAGNDITITSNKILNGGTISSGNDIWFEAGGAGALVLNGLLGSLEAARDINITSHDVDNFGSVVADRDLTITATGTVGNGAGAVLEAGNIVLTGEAKITADTLTNLGSISAPDAITIVADTVTNNGSVIAGDQLAISNGVDLNGDRVASTTVTFGPGSTTSARAGFIGASTFTQNGTFNLLNGALFIDGGTANSSADLLPATQVTFGTGSVTTITNGSAIISASNFDSDGAITVNGGGFLVDGGFTGATRNNSTDISFTTNSVLTADNDIKFFTTLFGNDGDITSNNSSVDINATGLVSNFDDGVIEAETTLTVNGLDIFNLGTLRSVSGDTTVTANGVFVNGDLLTTDALLVSGGKLTINALTVDNFGDAGVGGGISSLGNLVVDATNSFNNAVGADVIVGSLVGPVVSSATFETASFSNSGLIDVTGAFIANNGVVAGDTLPSTSFTNNGAINVGSVGNLQDALISAETFTAGSGSSLSATASIVLNGGTADAGSDILAMTSTTVDGSLVAGGFVVAINTEALTVGNTGSIISAGHLAVNGEVIDGNTARTATLTNNGTMTAGNAGAAHLNLLAETVVNNGDMSASGNVLISASDAGSITNNALATISADQLFSLEAGTITNAGTFDSEGAMGIGAAVKLDNSGLIEVGNPLASDLTITTPELINSGAINVAGDMVVNGGVSGVRNDVGGTIDAGSLRITAKSLHNDGAISSDSFITLFRLDTGVTGADDGSATIDATTGLTVVTAGDNDIHVLNAQTDGLLHGTNVLLISGGNIINKTSNTVIDTSTAGAGETSGSITLIAGVGNGLGGVFVDLVADNAVKLTSGAYQGGAINLGDSTTPALTANLITTASGAGGIAGNVTLAAFAGANPDTTGFISMSPVEFGVASGNNITTGGDGASGSVTILAGGTGNQVVYKNLVPITGSAITVGNVDTRSTNLVTPAQAAPIMISAGEPVFDGGPEIEFTNGAFDSGEALVAGNVNDLTDGSIVTSVLTTDGGDGTLAGNAGSTFTVQTKGDVNVNNSGSTAHNMVYRAENGRFTLLGNTLVAPEDALGNGGSIDINAGSVFFLGSGTGVPLTLDASGTANGGRVSFVKNSTSLLVVGTNTNAINIDVSGGLDAGSATVRNGGDLYVVMTAVPGATGSGVGINFTAGDGDGATLVFEAGTLGAGKVTVNGALNASGTGASGNGGSVTLISNSTTALNYGLTTSANTNGVQGAITVNGVGVGSQHGNVTLINRGGGVTYAPSTTIDFDNNVKDVLFEGTSSANGNVALSLTSILNATGNITLRSEANGATGNASINATKAITAGGNLLIDANSNGGTSTITTPAAGTLSATNIQVDNTAKSTATVTLAGNITTNGLGFGDLMLFNASSTGAANAKLDGSVTLSGSNADLVLTNDAATTGTVTTKAVNAGDSIIIFNNTGGAGSITIGGNLTAVETVRLQNDLQNVSGAPTGMITVNGIVTAGQNVRFQSIGNGNGGISISKNVTATSGDVELVASGKGNITTAGTAVVTAGNEMFVTAVTGAIGTGAGLAINTPELTFNSNGVVIFNSKAAATANVLIHASTAGTTASLTSLSDITTDGDITAPLGVTFKSTGTGNDIVLGGDLITNAATSGATKGGIVNLTVTGAGRISNDGSTITAETLNLVTGTNGNIGNVDPLTTDILKLSINALGNGDVSINNIDSNTVTVSTTARGAGSDTVIENVGSLVMNGVIAQAGTVLLETTGAGSTITLNAAIGTTATTLIGVNGEGGILGKGKLTALNVELVSNSGNIGGTGIANAINVSTPDMQVLRAPNGSVNVKNHFVSTIAGGSVLDASAIAGTSFTYNVAGSVDVTDISAGNGSIVVSAAKGILRVMNGADILAANGGITLQNMVGAAGAITIGNLVNTDNQINIETSGKNGGTINIVIGAVPATPIVGPAPSLSIPANVAVYEIGTGGVFFGKNGINVVGTAPTATVPFNASFTADNTNLVFNTGASAKTAITVNQGVNIYADPPTPLPNPVVALNVNPFAPQTSTVNASNVIAPQPADAHAGTVATSAASAPAIVLSAPSLTNSTDIFRGQLANQIAMARMSSGWISDTELMTGEIPAVLHSGEGVNVATRVSGHADMYVPSTKSGAAKVFEAGVTKVEGATKVVGLNKGSVVFAPSVDTVVQTPYGNVNIAAKSVVLVLSFNGGVGVYNLDDMRRDAVSINAFNKVISLKPGSTAVITGSNATSFDQVNPAQLFLYRNITEQAMGPAFKAYVGEFSVFSAINAVLPLKQLVNSKDAQARRMGDHLLKTAAIVLQTRGGHAQYRQILKPNLAAYAAK